MYSSQCLYASSVTNIVLCNWGLQVNWIIKGCSYTCHKNITNKAPNNLNYDILNEFLLDINHLENTSRNLPENSTKHIDY